VKGFYRNFEINVTREKSLGGAVMLYFGIIDPLGCEIYYAFEISSDTVRGKYKEMKETVDEILRNPSDWYDGDEDACENMLRSLTLDLARKQNKYKQREE